MGWRRRYDEFLFGKTKNIMGRENDTLDLCKNLFSMFLNPLL